MVVVRAFKGGVRPQVERVSESRGLVTELAQIGKHKRRGALCGPGREELAQETLGESGAGWAFEMLSW